MIQVPGSSPYPIVDFASRVASGGTGENSATKAMLPVAIDSDPKKHLENVRLYLQEFREEETTEIEGEDVKVIGFSTQPNGLA